MAPRFSVVMPTYNRADTLPRAIASVRAQSLGDWELIVVDDGSTDETPAILASIDEPRLRVVRQQNHGVGAARNAGMAAATGALLAFLDSDDEWLPHHLALANAFFAAHPAEHLFTTEFWEVFGPGLIRRHFDAEMVEWYPVTARRIGSTAFRGLPPLGDPRLWYFDRVAPVGDWAHDALAGGPWDDVRHYRGMLFDHWRWGWLGALQTTVITRAALEAMGPFDLSYAIANDFGWMAELSRRFTTHLVTVPGCYKHEYAPDGGGIREDHLVTGRTAVRFHEDVLRYLEELFLTHSPHDRDLRALRGFRQYLVGQAALLEGDRATALRHLRAAVQTYPASEARALLWLARAVPSGRGASILYRDWQRTAAIPARIRRVVGRAGARAARPGSDSR